PRFSVRHSSRPSSPTSATSCGGSATTSPTGSSASTPTTCDPPTDESRGKAMTTQTIVREFEADLVVAGATVVADDVVALTLAAADGAPLPPWTPGAHIDLVLGDDLVRQYSLCGSPADRGTWRLGILRTPDSRGGSKAVHADLHDGAVV